MNPSCVQMWGDNIFREIPLRANHAADPFLPLCSDTQHLPVAGYSCRLRYREVLVVSNRARRNLAKWMAMRTHQISGRSLTFR